MTSTTRWTPFAITLLGSLALGGLLLSSTSVEAAATTVREPRWGIPHIYADTDAELAYENGRQVAMDRLGQLILFARAGRGTLAQAFGLLRSMLGLDLSQPPLSLRLICAPLLCPHDDLGFSGVGLGLQAADAVVEEKYLGI